MKDVKIGSISFNTAVLKSCSSVKEAQERFKNKDKTIVKRAYEEAKKIKSSK